MKIGNYEVIKKIDYGNLAESYIAKGPAGDQVYLKRLVLETAQDELKRRFPLEIRALEDLKEHPNVCTLLDSGTDVNGNPYFVTEFVDGFNLEEWLKDSNKRFSLEHIYKIITSILSVLSYSHNRTENYIHRDIKPSNIMMTYDFSEVKLIDFGIVHIDAPTIIRITQRPIGTLDYMPPECWDPNSRVDERSDLWSAGVLMYKLLTYKIPYNGNPQMAQPEQTITPPSSIREWIPAELDKVVLQAIEREPEQRFQSAMAFKEALDHVYGRLFDAIHPKINGLAQTLRRMEFRDQAKDFLIILSNHAHLVPHIETAAKCDHIESQWLLGICRQYGIGIEQSLNAAKKWFEIAGQAGHHASQYHFALLMEHDQIAPDESLKSKIYQWYAYAAQGGYAPAQYKIGLSQWTGAVLQCHKDALQWFKKAADQNYIPAYSTLATCYERGWGTSVDMEEAVRLYRIAANEQHAPSMYYLGQILTEGVQGISRDKTNGQKYMQQAADLGFEEVENKIFPEAIVMRAR